MKPLRILVACEFSGTVRNAFAELGHECWSCDLLPSESPGLHYRGDVTHLLDGWTPVRFTMDCDPELDGWCVLSDQCPSECKCYGPTQEEPELEYMENEHGQWVRPVSNPHWDLMIAHPPCTYLSVSGMHWTTRGLRDSKLTEDALEFVKLLMDAPINKIAIENPISVISSRIRKPDQIVQPYEYGHDASKATCLWLKNLPKLKPTDYVEPRIINGKKRWGNQCDSGQNKLAPSPDRWKKRAEFYAGVALAMANQWGVETEDKFTLE
jgi:hypothetical protein